MVEMDGMVPMVMEVVEVALQVSLLMVQMETLAPIPVPHQHLLHHLEVVMEAMLVADKVQVI